MTAVNEIKTVFDRACASAGVEAPQYCWMPFPLMVGRPGCPPEDRPELVRVLEQKSVGAALWLFRDTMLRGDERIMSVTPFIEELMRMRNVRSSLIWLANTIELQGCGTTLEGLFAEPSWQQLQGGSPSVTFSHASLQQSLLEARDLQLVEQTDPALASLQQAIASIRAVLVVLARVDERSDALAASIHERMRPRLRRMHRPA